MAPIVKEETVKNIDKSDVIQIQKQWLKNNQDVSTRELVGKGFRALKEIIQEDGPLTNAKIKILNARFEVTAYIKTIDYGGMRRKKWRIQGDRVIRYDKWQTISMLYCRKKTSDGIKFVYNKLPTVWGHTSSLKQHDDAITSTSGEIFLHFQKNFIIRWFDFQSVPFLHNYNFPD